MTKRHADPAPGTKARVKKRRGVKVRTVTIPDSDGEDSSNVDTEYARLLRTRVTASGKADSVTMNSLPLFEVKKVADDDNLSDPGLNIQPEEVSVENAVPSKPAKKPRKKANDSVRYLEFIELSPHTDHSPD